MVAENCTVSIEVEEDHILIVFDRKHDYVAMPWQDAFQLAETIDMAIKDVACDVPFNHAQFKAEHEQVKLNTYQGFVFMFFEHTDRIKLHPFAAKIMSSAVKKTAQDAQYLSRGIALSNLK